MTLQTKEGAGASSEPGRATEARRLFSVAVVGGSGELGYGLSVQLARAGDVVIVGSRDAERAQEAAQRVAAASEGSVQGMANADAVGAADVVVLSIPFAHHAATLAGLKGCWSPGQLVIDATVPLAASVGGRATRMLGVWQGSAAEQTAELVPSHVRVVSALHTVSAAELAELEGDVEQDVLVCGDDREAKADAEALLGRIPGLRVIDAGRLEMSRVCESLTALLISINIRHKVHAGIRITGLAPPETSDQAQQG